MMRGPFSHGAINCLWSLVCAVVVEERGGGEGWLHGRKTIKTIYSHITTQQSNAKTKTSFMVLSVSEKKRRQIV